MSENHHADHVRSDMEQMIVDILSKTRTSYLTVNQIKRYLPSGLLHELGLNRQKSGNVQVLDALKASIGNRLRIYKGPRALYIGINRSDDDIILDKIKQRPGVSSKALGGRLPMLKGEYLACLNRLMENGRIRCTFNQVYRSALWPVEPKASVQNQQRENLQAMFKDAYDRIGKGRGFVRIHRVREALRWPPETFDGLLRDLMAAYVIELHGGDPSALSENEIRKSFVDENGTLYITLSWWGEDHEK